MDMDLGRLTSEIERRNRRSMMLSGLLLTAIVAAAIAIIFYTSSAVKDANTQLAEVTAALDGATKELESKQAQLTKANAEIAGFEAKVAGLKSELERQSKELAEAIKLSQYTYPIDWNDVKAMFAISPQAAPVFSEIVELRERTKWGMTNTPEGGYNSPGFAELVLKRGGMPGLSSLRHDNGQPKPGDIIRYQTGYHMFYFEDQNGVPFVVGMTPFGVTALKRDFGVKEIDIIRLGLVQ